jgi:hydroxyacylglutathione hydrolase
MGVHAEHWRVVMPSQLEIVPVPAFSDNYIWLVHDAESGETAVVDPGDAAPALAEVERRGWRVGQVWNTHWHPDHTGGNLQVKAATGARISAPTRRDIPGMDVALGEGGDVQIGRHRGQVMEVPGHTLDHVAIVFEEAGVAFVGDTLFAMGCGRLFEGTPEQMFESLRRLAALPGETKLYPAHEYTLSNANFAAHAEPGNSAIAERLAAVKALRDNGNITLPTSVAEERATNPFVRSSSSSDLARLRAQKDSFR